MYTNVMLEQNNLCPKILNVKMHLKKKMFLV